MIPREYTGKHVSIESDAGWWGINFFYGFMGVAVFDKRKTQTTIGRSLHVGPFGIVAGPKVSLG